MSQPDNSHAKGLMLTAIGGMALTVDIPLIRLADGQSWSILMLRSATTLATALVVWAIWRALSPRAPALISGKPGLAVAILYGLGSISFITAVYHTSTANLVFLLTFNTMFSALLGWIFLGERPRPPTLLAMAAMIVGITIIVGDSIGTGNLFGDCMAILSAFLIANAITITRATGRDMGFAALVGVALPLVVAVFMVREVGYHVEAPWWILFNGAVVMPIAFFCLATGPKYIPGPQVAMFYLLETVLAPIWVWLIFSDAPTRSSLIGGSILIVTLIAHSLWQLHDSRRRRAAEIQYPI